MYAERHAGTGVVVSHVRTWHVELSIAEETDTAAATAILTTDNGIVVRVSQQTPRNGGDVAAPEIGAEIAAGHALGELARELMSRAAQDAESLARG